MRLLRKSGIRAPWQPAPLQSATLDPLRGVVVATSQPPVPGAQLQVIGRLSRPEDVNWPARPAIVQVGAQPVPGATLWEPTPPKNANTDPLRPLAAQAKPPDATLMQSGIAWLGRLSRDEDTSRPARPATAIGAPPQLPSAQVQAFAHPFDGGAQPPPDRLSPTTVAVGTTPTPLGQAQPVGAAHDTPLLRLAITSFQAGAQPSPAAQALATYAPRDQIAAQPDRLSPAQLVVGAVPQPLGQAQPIGMPRSTPNNRLAQTVVIGAAGLPLSGAVTWSGAPKDEDRAGRTPQIARPELWPLGAIALTMPAPRDMPPPAGRAPIIQAPRPLPPSSVLAFATMPHMRPAFVFLSAGSVHSPQRTGSAQSDATHAALSSPSQPSTAASSGVAATITGA